MNARQLQFKTRLDDLAERLRVKPATARALARELGCSKPTVYSRIGALERRGVKVSRTPARDGTRGPLAYEFAVPPKRSRRAGKR